MNNETGQIPNFSEQANTVRRLNLLTKSTWSSPPAIACAAALLFAIGCGSSGSNTPPPAMPDSPMPVISANVSAATGGVFMSDDGQFKITIAADALSGDSQLEVYREELPDFEGAWQTAGHGYQLHLDDEITINNALKVEVRSDAAPTHPELAELAVYEDGQWMRATGSFFRASDSTVVALTMGTQFKPMLRTLQAENGDGVMRGQTVFMEETFGNEAFFGGVLGLHDLLNGISPATAVSVGVQIDISKVPQAIVDVLTGSDYAAKQAALENPAITRALIKAGAVIGVRGFYDDADSDMMSTTGITCALCHTNVTPTDFEITQGEMTALPIGSPLIDGIPNTAMNAGTILSLTPFVQAAGEPLVSTLQGWGPGRFDIRALPDNPLDDGVNNPTDTPPLWNFVDLDEQNYAYDWDGLFISGEGENLAIASQAEAVYDLVMHANGAFATDTGTIAPQLAITPPDALVQALVQAEADQPGNDIDEQSLRDVQSFQRSITSPAPMAFDESLAEEGFELFYGKAQCGGCHMSAEFTGPVLSSSIVLQAPEGGLAGGIKTPGLRGIAYTAPFFHDGSAATLMDVMDIYSGRTTVELSDSEKLALVEYMKSL